MNSMCNRNVLSYGAGANPEMARTTAFLVAPIRLV